ncbi:MarR family transcriptional regulator [Roseivirga pacifica]|uniref:MarR family transcriptional regulator n=1 Tax=Roseivirga pacifica TaxID=1267423 RepID=UPI003BAC9D41
MENDFLIEMGYPGLTGRLKRLSDLFVYQTKEFYKEFEVDIEPNWHMIFMLLQNHEALTVMDMAAMLHLSHPSIIRMVNKMKKNGYIDSVQDEADNRKFYLQLTDKAKRQLPKLETYWQAGNKALEELLESNTELLEQLTIVEKNISTENFKERMVKLLND